MKLITTIAMLMLLSAPAIAKAYINGPMPAECESRWAPPWMLHFHASDAANAKRCAPWFKKKNPRRRDNG